MNYLLDTNHWSYLQRGHAAVVNRIRQLPRSASLYMPVVAQAELLAGVELVPDPPRRAELRALYLQAIEQTTEIIPIDSRVAERFAAIFVQLQTTGRPLPTNDIWIAAIAMVHDLTVISHDAHFQFIGVRCEDWTVTS